MAGDDFLFSSDFRINLVNFSSREGNLIFSIIDLPGQVFVGADDLVKLALEGLFFGLGLGHGRAELINLLIQLLDDRLFAGDGVL